MKHRQNLSFRSKLIFMFFVAGLLPLAFSLVFLQLSFISSSTTAITETPNSEFDYLFTTFNNFLGNINNSIIRLQNSDTIKKNITNTNPVELATEIQTITENLSDLAFFTLFNENGKSIYSNFDLTSKYKNINDDVFSSLQKIKLEQTNKLWWETSDSRKKNDICFKIITTITENTKIKGFIVFFIPKSSLNKVFNVSFFKTNSIFVADSNWNCVFSASDDFFMIPDLKEIGIKSRLNQNSNSAEDFFVRQNKLSGFYLMYQQKININDRTTRFFIVIIISAIFISIVVYALFIRIFTKQFLKPIKKLNNAMILVENENLEIQLKNDRTDELGQLTSRFNKTVKKMKDYMEEIVNRQKLLNETQIRMMQAQLNPHFLYNTLDTIKWIAKINKINTIANITTDLADILRYSISNEEFVSLEKELELLTHYIQIQKIRFPDKFELKTKIEEGVLDFNVPKLMLQPLVENSIIHGFDQMNSGVITVTAEQISSSLVINVIDNGKGMDDETLEMIKSNLAHAKGHLGLYNVNEIIKLHYGKNSGLKFIPMQKPGTCIRIILEVGK